MRGTPYAPLEIRGRSPAEILTYDPVYALESSIELRYYVKTDGEIEKVTAKIAEEETTGRWIGRQWPETELYRHARARPLRIEKYGPGEGVVTIQAPLSNLDLEADPYYQLQMLSVGGPILEFVYYTHVAFLDFKLPASLLARFPGPRFGVRRLREEIGLEPNQPLLGTIVKPCCGLTVDEVAERCYQAALGGAVFIKDDEKMMNPEYCPLERKVRTVSEALRRAEQETGLRCLYAPHMPFRPDKLRDAAHRVINWGASALMFNVILASHIGTLQILAEDPEIDVPLYAHCGGLAALTTGPRRIDARVIAKLVRLCGADFFQIGVLGQRDCHVNSQDDELLYMLADTFRNDELPVRDTVPVTAGGLGAMNLGRNLHGFQRPDRDYALAPLAGSNLLDHPAGPRAGAVAMWQAARAYFEEEVTEPEALRGWAQQNDCDELTTLFKDG